MKVCERRAAASSFDKLGMRRTSGEGVKRSTAATAITASVENLILSLSKGEGFGPVRWAA